MMLRRFMIALMLAGVAFAQRPTGGLFPWWEGPLIENLNLTDAQRGQIRGIVREYRGRMFEVRSNVDKAEGELDSVFNSDPVDPKHGSEVIDRLVHARSEMTKAVSEMSLKLRAVLTTQQWQELQKRQREDLIPTGGRGRGRGPQKGRRDGKSPVPPQAQSAPAEPQKGQSSKSALN